MPHSPDTSCNANPAAPSSATQSDAALNTPTQLLCFDIGNTSAHWALFNANAIHARGDIPTSAITEGARSLLRAYPEAALGACSVVPKATDALRALALAEARELYLLTAANAPTL